MENKVETDLIDALLRDEELQASWHSFHTVRSVMRKESAVFLGLILPLKWQI